MKVRTAPQNRLLHALVRDVADALPLVPWRRSLVLEAWKRYFLQIYVRDARMEAYANGDGDPFPVRPVPSSSLDSWQMSDLIACTDAWMAWNGIEWSEKTQRMEGEL